MGINKFRTGAMVCKQLGFADYEETTAKKRTHKENLLAEIDQVAP